MKKLLAVLLSLLLLSQVALTVVLVQNNRLLKQLLTGGGGLPAASAPAADRPVSNGETRELLHVAEEKYLEPSGDWIFSFAISNTTDTDLFIQSLAFIDNGEEPQLRDIDGDPFLFEMMMGPDFRTTPLKPGEVMTWQDGHPGEHLTDRTYLFTFIGADGTQYTATYEYRLLMEVRPDAAGNRDYANDPGQDLLTLRHGADFEQQVAPDVFWVPVSSLGESAYSNQEITRLLGESPEVKQREIHRLYEALQLYQIGNFAASDDNVRMAENGVNWEHHKPGYYAVLSNNGCCATSANWLNYILAGEYEQLGFVATSQRDGSGHIYNYILHDGWYYFIDLTHYRTDWVATATESGDLDDYYRSDFVLGNLHKCRTVEAYVRYVQDRFGDPPGLMFQYMAPDCLAIDSARSQSGVSILYEDAPGVELKVIFDDPGDGLDYRLVTPPSQRPSWG